MWVASFETGWGTRLPRVFINKYFSREPSLQEIVAAFKKEVPRISDYTINQGPLVVHKLEVEF